MFQLFVKLLIGLFTIFYRGVMAVFNSILGVIKNNRINKGNLQRRGITEYRPSEIGGFFLPTLPATNVVISGGDNRIRSMTIHEIARAACINNMPVVILHEANQELEKMMQITWANSGRLTLINKGNPIYDPFVGLTDAEISKLVMDAAPKEFDIKPNAKYYIDGMIAYIRAINKQPRLNVFVKCPHADLFNKVDALVANGTITDPQGQAIKSRLMQGQSECYKLESYFSSLEDQFSSILSRKLSQDHKSITRTIDDADVILIDITSNVNKLLINILVTQIKYAIGKGKFVTFVADELSTENSELFTGLIRMNNDKCKLTVSSRDVFAMCGGEEKVFHTLLGNCGKAVIYCHTSGASATKWAEAIGYYDKTEISTSVSSGSSRQSPFQFFAGTNTTSTTNYNNKREYIVKPEEISRMQSNEVYIIDGVTPQLAHTRLV